MTDLETVAILKSLFPPRTFDWLEAETGDGGLGDILDALAEEANADAFALADLLQAQITPSTATSDGGRLQDWEKALGFEGSRVAVYASDAGRVAQVLSRLREGDTPTIDAITAALAAVTGNVSAITILEVSRTALTAANTHSFGTLTATAGNASSVSITIGDNALASAAGARLTLNVSGGDPDDFTIEIVGPDATGVFATPVTVDGADYTFFFPEFAGKVCDGTFTLFLDNTAGVIDAQIDGADWHIEGIGRDTGTGAEGLGAAIFEWAALIDPALITPGTFDLEVAHKIVTRWNPAWCRGYLALKNSNGGSSAVFDDPNTPFDQGIFA